METTPRDLARIGLLVLAGGEFSGQRIVSKKWIDSSLVASQPFNPLYGLLWWLHPQANTVAAHGYLETDLHVVRDMGLVVVRMQRAPVAGTNPDAYDRLAVPLYRTFVLPTQKQNQ
jgi:CubicO group peptidase (beta-lactamase class C family)